MIEVSLVSGNAFSLIARLASRDLGALCVGAGTVRSAEDARRAADAGARFLISPHTSARVVGETRRLGLVSIPGALTPSEVMMAIDAGAHAVKLFPAQCVGPAGFAALRAPFPGVRFVPTGGVTVKSARRYFQLGAWAVGIGSPLTGADLRGASALTGLVERSRALAAVARDAPACTADVSV